MTQGKSLSPQKRHKIAQIKEALGKSDAALHGYMSKLDGFNRSEHHDVTRDVSRARIQTLDKIHHELLRAVDQLGAFDTGLRAQEDLRKALINSAAGYAAWSFALSSRKPSEIAAARARVQRHFDTAAHYGGRGTSRLARGI